MKKASPWRMSRLMVHLRYLVPLHNLLCCFLPWVLSKQQQVSHRSLSDWIGETVVRLSSVLKRGDTKDEEGKKERCTSVSRLVLLLTAENNLLICYIQSRSRTYLHTQQPLSDLFEVMLNLV